MTTYKSFFFLIIIFTSPQKKQLIFVAMLLFSLKGDGVHAFALLPHTSVLSSV